ncbi:MAG: hypothetical protein ACFFD4_18105 [Candidatus Odinarchaeota archaeon]
MAKIEKEASFPARNRILQYISIKRSRPIGKNDLCVKERAMTMSTNSSSIQRRTDAGTHSLYVKDSETLPKTVIDFISLFLEEFIDHKGKEAAKKLLEDIGKDKARKIRETIERNSDETGSRDQLEQLISNILGLYEKQGKYPLLIEEENCFLLQNYNCLLYNIAKKNSLICRVEEAMLTELFGFRPIKEKCIRDGDDYCQYRIHKETSIEFNTRFSGNGN